MNVIEYHAVAEEPRAEMVGHGLSTHIIVQKKMFSQSIRKARKLNRVMSGFLVLN